MPAPVIPIAEAVERRRRKRALENLDQLADSVEALADEPDAHGNFTLLGNLRRLEGAFEDATADYSRALSLEPNDVHAWTGRARCYLALGELDDALADLDEALALTPGDAKLHYLRGYCLSHLVHARWERGADESETEGDQQTRCAAALASLERAIELGLRTVDVYFELVSVREEMGDGDAHLAMLDRALAAFPDEVPLLAVRRDRRGRRGDLEGAAADLAHLQELGVKV